MISSDNQRQDHQKLTSEEVRKLEKAKRQDRIRKAEQRIEDIAQAKQMIAQDSSVANISAAVAHIPEPESTRQLECKKLYQV